MASTSIKAEPKAKAHTPSNASTSPRLEDLLRFVIDTATHQNGGADRFREGSDLEEEIVLDAELDGARYLIVRMPQRGRPEISLSPREQEIVRMVAQGHPNKVIADVLSISAWTVCTHLRRIFAKLGVGTRAAMVARVSEMAGPHLSVAARERIRP